MVTRLADNCIFALKEYFRKDICSRQADNSISFLPQNRDAIDTGIKDFLTEAERLNRQNILHPNLVKVIEAFTANGTAYYVMEFIEGENLWQYMRRNEFRPLDWEQVKSVMQPVVRAVDLLHRNKITHLDIKHENIVLTEEADGALRPVVIDFGLSKHYDRKGNATSTLTTIGCTNGFAPLEQYQGLPTFTPQADIYALAATMLFLLTGKWPPISSEITEKKVRDLLPDSLPEKITRGIVNAMKMLCYERTPTVRALALDLELDLENNDEKATHLLTAPVKSQNKIGRMLQRALSSSDRENSGIEAISDLDKLAYLPYVKNREPEFMEFRAAVEDFILLEQYKAAYNLCMESTRNFRYAEYCRFKMQELIPLLKKKAAKDQISGYLLIIGGAIVAAIVLVAYVLVKMQ